MVVGDIMHTEVVSVRADDSVRTAAAVMLDSGFSALPVLDEDDNVVGLISQADIIGVTVPEYLRNAVDLSFLPGSFSFPVPGGCDLDTTTVGDILRTDILYTVEEDEPIVEVARIMVQHHVRRCPVVRERKLVGMVSRRDLMELIVRPTLEGTTP